MRLVFYGRLAEAIAPEIELDAPSGCSVAQLRERLAAAYPKAGQALLSRQVRACVASAFVHDDSLVGAADTVEFLPPVSGG